MRKLLIQAAVAVSALAAAPALAQPAAQWPDHPVKMIVPLGAGGPADLVGRYIAQQLGEQFKQSFFIENRPGAAGIIGTAEAAKAAPDGYTLLVVASPHINLEILNTNKTYDLMRDFAPVGRAFSTDAVMVVIHQVPAKTVKEFIDLAKSKPGKLTYRVVGTGLEQASRRRAVQADDRHRHPACRLQGLDRRAQRHRRRPRRHDVRRGAVGRHPTCWRDRSARSASPAASASPRCRTCRRSRRPAVPGYEHTGWFGIMAPTGTPKPIVDKLNAEMRELVAKPDVKAYWEKQGTETMSMTPAESEAYLRAEIEKWTKVVKAANIKLE